MQFQPIANTTTSTIALACLMLFSGRTPSAEARVTIFESLIPINCVHQELAQAGFCAIEKGCTELLDKDNKGEAPLTALSLDSKGLKNFYIPIDALQCETFEDPICPATAICPACKDKLDALYRCIILESDYSYLDDLANTCPLDCPARINNLMESNSTNSNQQVDDNGTIVGRTDVEDKNTTGNNPESDPIVIVSPPTGTSTNTSRGPIEIVSTNGTTTNLLTENGTQNVNHGMYGTNLPFNNTDTNTSAKNTNSTKSSNTGSKGLANTGTNSSANTDTQSVNHGVYGTNPPFSNTDTNTDTNTDINTSAKNTNSTKSSNTGSKGLANTGTNTGANTGTSTNTSRGPIVFVSTNEGVTIHDYHHGTITNLLTDPLP